MKARAAFVAVAAVTLVVLTAGPVSAHTVTKPSVSCDSVSASASGFSTGPHTVTFHVTVDGTASTKTATFTGSSGSPSASIADLTTASGPLTISAYGTWTDDGGGQTGTATVTKTCHEAPPVTTVPPREEQETPLPPVESGTQPEQTPPAAQGAATPSSSIPAAVPVVAVPRTTG